MIFWRGEVGRVIRPQPLGFQITGMAPSIIFQKPDGSTVVTYAPYATQVLGLVPNAYWKLNEPSGTTAGDSSGNARDGVYQNAPTLGVTPGALNGAPANTAVTFNGTTQYISVTDNALLDPGDIFTLEGWVNWAASGTARPIFDKDATGYKFQLSSTGQPQLIKSGGSTIVTATSSVFVSIWNHVVATKAGSVVHLYLNGDDVTGSVSNQTILGTASGLKIAADYGSGFFNGSLDEMAIYPVALTAAQVKANYQAGVATMNNAAIAEDSTGQVKYTTGPNDAILDTVGEWFMQVRVMNASTIKYGPVENFYVEERIV